MAINFNDTTKAFAHKTNAELKFSYWVFKLMNNPTIVNVSSDLALFALKLKLPIAGITKATVFKQFCGGETVSESKQVIAKLAEANVGAILDYSAEGGESEKEFDHTCAEIIKTIDIAAETPSIPVACMKVTGIARFGLLEKLNAKSDLSDKEKIESQKVVERLNKICTHAFNKNIPIYIDAEDYCIQDAIDQMAESMMMQFNKSKAIVFTTLQMYRWDRIEYLNKLIAKARANGIKLGIKFVRGAYMEKENERAKKGGYPTPIQPSKQATDNDYNKALEISVNNIDIVEICAGTHNENSSNYLTELMQQNQLEHNDSRIYFSQLFGMSDHISFNLAAYNYNVSKYLPYGPVKTAIPYLIRRAQENTSIAGQMGKELRLIIEEKKKRGI